MQSTKEQVLGLLRDNGQQFISGQEMADRLYVTRAAIWKAIKALRSEGISIEAISNRGYRLVQSNDMLSRVVLWDTLQKNWTDGKELPFLMEDIRVFDQVDSTNDIANRYGNEQSIEGDKRDMVFLADEQLNGRGRRGRAFLSPSGTGLYMSLLLHPQMDFNQATMLTCLAGITACRVIERMTGAAPLIKWVNDIFLDGRKVAGILTEGHASLEDGGLDHVVLGIGINVREPKDGWAPEISKVAGCISTQGVDRSVLAGLFLAEFFQAYGTITNEELAEEYRSRSMLIGKYVQINPHEKVKGDTRKNYALVTGIDDHCHLQVRLENGTEVSLSTGEVSVVQY